MHPADRQDPPMGQVSQVPEHCSGSDSIIWETCMSDVRQDGGPHLIVGMTSDRLANSDRSFRLASPVACSCKQHWLPKPL